MRRFAARAVALVALWASIAWAEPQPAQQAMLELIVNGARRGEVFVRLQGGDVWVPFASLTAAGLVRLKAATQLYGGIEHVSLRAAALPFDYDEASLTLTITAPPAVLARTTMDLSARPSSELRYDWAPSAFLNYAPRLSNARLQCVCRDGSFARQRPGRNQRDLLAGARPHASAQPGEL
ncbi:MAG: hypothetical protein ABI895_23490 [Deltaproteobacteria bacterium]